MAFGQGMYVLADFPLESVIPSRAVVIIGRTDSVSARTNIKYCSGLSNDCRNVFCGCLAETKESALDTQLHCIVLYATCILGVLV